MNKKIKYLLVIIGGALITILIPLIINVVIINNNIYSKASNDGWASFFGSYFGGILGGFGTLAGVLITLRETRKENIKPFLVIDFDETPKEIYNPEKYSEINKNDNIVNFNQIPLISKIFGISIRNTGKGYAQNINITMLIKIKDALVSDNNLFWLARNPLEMERISVFEDSYIQTHKITYIGSEGDKKLLPINSALNGIIMCSIWNIDRFTSLKDEDFEQTKLYYNIKKKELALTIPDVSIHLQYYDLDNNKYEVIYKIGFNFILKLIGSYNLVKAKLDFEGELLSIKKKVRKVTKPIKEKKQKKISRKMKQVLSLRNEWCDKVYEFGMSIGLSDSMSKSISRDGALERYFFLCYENEWASLEQLIIIVAICCYNEIDIRGFSKKKLINLHEKLRQELMFIIKNKDKKKYLRIINKEQINYSKINNLQRLKEILMSEKEIFRYYFKSYEKNDNKENQLIHIYSDSRDGVNIDINIGNDKMKTELGFYRIGFNYRKVENREDNLIVSAIKNNYKNVEIGFLDESGGYFDNNNEWKCIYLR